MVKTTAKLTFGTEVADWQERIDVSRLRGERAEKARQVMRRHGVAAMLVTRSDNCRYLTGLVGPEFMPQIWYVLFFAEDDPVVFALAGWPQQMPDQAPWIKHWRISHSWLGGVCGPEATRQEAKLFAAGVYEELKQRGLVGEKLAIVAFDAPAREALTERGITLVDAWPLMLEARAVKTKDEINCLKMVAAICEAGWYKVWESLKVGMRDTVLSRIATQALFEAGAHDVPPIGVFSGPLTFEKGFRASGRLIQSGDLLYMPVCGVSYLGYRSCTYRTLIAGRKPNDQEKDWYKKLLERIDAIIDAIKPGATTADAARHFVPAANLGYKEEAELHTTEIGHGIGLYQYELPLINRQWSLEYPQVFEPGMVVAVESLEGEHRVGGVRLEDMVLVTEDGAEILDHMPREEIWSPYGLAT